MPTAVPAGFTRVFSEDFNTPAAVGQFLNVYGSRFGTYEGGHDTSGYGVWSSSKVLSVANGNLHYNLHSESGQAYSSAAIPMSGGNYASFTYGQVGMAVKGSELGKGFKIAFLMWPSSNSWSNEVDFPENDDMSGALKAVSLNYSPAGNGANGFSGTSNTGVSLADGNYHTFLLTWLPGSMTASIDGKVVQTFSGSAVPSQPMRVTLQAETDIGSGPVPTGSSASVDVPYVFINHLAS